MPVETKLIDQNAFYGTSTFYHFDHATGEITFETRQDAEPIIEANKARFNEAPTRWGEGKLVASIPLTIYYDLKRKGITKDPAAFRRWLNDPDNRAFRTRPGHL